MEVEVEAGVAVRAGLLGERRTDTGCLSCHLRSSSVGRRRSSMRTWWLPAHGSAPGPGRAQTHGQQPGEGLCLQGVVDKPQRMRNHTWFTWCRKIVLDICFDLLAMAGSDFSTWDDTVSTKSHKSTSLLPLHADSYCSHLSLIYSPVMAW